MSRFSTRAADDSEFRTIAEYADFSGDNKLPLIYISREQLQKLIDGGVMIYEENFGDYVGFMIEPEEVTR